MTIDEAIEYYIKAATQRELADEEKGDYDKWNETRFMTKKQSTQIIADDRQLAEWLRELKELREENKVLISECDRLIKEKGELLSKVSGAVKAADVQPVDRWISVDDRLPEEIGYYLVIIGNDMLYSIDIAEYSENRWHMHDRVIYWQDLPDYPKTIKGARMDGDTE